MAATWQEFARALLGELRVPSTSDNVDALLAWFSREQPPEKPNAAYNPLNIQAGNFAHTSTSGSGQYNFADFGAGVAQTAAFIRQPFYTGILAALGRGNDPGGVLSAVQQSPWASGHYGYTLPAQLGTIRSNRARYAAGRVGGSGDASGFDFANIGPIPTPGDAGKAIVDALAPVLLTVVLVAGGVALVVLGVRTAVSPNVKERISDKVGEAAPILAAAG